MNDLNERSQKQWNLLMEKIFDVEFVLLKQYCDIKKSEKSERRRKAMNNQEIKNMIVKILHDVMEREDVPQRLELLYEIKSSIDMAITTSIIAKALTEVLKKQDEINSELEQLLRDLSQTTETSIDEN